MISLWVFLGGITLYIIGTFLEWLADQLHGDRKGGNQMIVNQYDDVLLTDGRMAGIVEKFSETEFLGSPGICKLIDGLGSAFGLVLGMTGACAMLLLVSVLALIAAVIP